MVQLRGIVDVLGGKYSTPQRIHLIHRLDSWNGNLYIWCQSGWERWVDSYRPLTNSSRKTLELLVRNAGGVGLWAGVKPGDARFCGRWADRRKVIAHCRQILECGAQGIFLSMSDTHQHLLVKEEDGIAHAQMARELYGEIGASFKALVGEKYWGARFYGSPYWQPILKVLPNTIMVAWTGSKPTYNKEITEEEIPRIKWPLLLFDNYYASAKIPSRRYSGREELKGRVKGVVLNPNLNYYKQLPFLEMALKSLAGPQFHPATANSFLTSSP